MPICFNAFNDTFVVMWVNAQCFPPEFKIKDLECLPYGVAQPLKEAIQECFANPPPDLTEDAYRLIGKLLIKIR